MTKVVRLETRWKIQTKWLKCKVVRLERRSLETAPHPDSAENKMLAQVAEMEKKSRGREKRMDGGELKRGI